MQKRRDEPRETTFVGLFVCEFSHSRNPHRNDVIPSYGKGLEPGSNDVCLHSAQNQLYLPIIPRADAIVVLPGQVAE